MGKKLSELIRAYYQIRELKEPTTTEAILWAMSELGEACDVLLEMKGGWTRNHPEDKRDTVDALAEELADTLMMIMVAGHTIGFDLEEVLIERMKRKARSDLTE